MTYAALLLWPCHAVFVIAAIPDPVAPDPNSPRPIDAVDSVFIEDLTWMEIRDAMKGGVDTAIVATGGIEQNGPYIVTGKHNYRAPRHDRGDRPEARQDARRADRRRSCPKATSTRRSLHMKYPGTISLTEDTYQRLLTDICSSLKTHGFKRIILLGDSGGNQTGMKAVAEKLNAAWEGRAANHLRSRVLRLRRSRRVGQAARHQASSPRACTTTS